MEVLSRSHVWGALGYAANKWMTREWISGLSNSQFGDSSLITAAVSWRVRGMWSPKCYKRLMPEHSFRYICKLMLIYSRKSATDKASWGVKNKFSWLSFRKLEKEIILWPGKNSIKSFIEGRWLKISALTQPTGNCNYSQKDPCLSKINVCSTWVKIRHTSISAVDTEASDKQGGWNPEPSTEMTRLCRHLPRHPELND